MRQEADAVVLVQSNNNLAVATAFEVVVGPLLKLGAYTIVVVELAVNYSMDLVGSIMEGLSSVW
jgi:hypothetical protein